MRTRIRVSGLLVALTLLLTAIPIFDCCFGASAGAGHGGPSHLIHVIPLAAAPLPEAEQAPVVVHDTSARGCTDHAAPAQTPYIETSGGSGGAPASTRSSTDAASHPASLTLANAPPLARPPDKAADATGPPLWLTTCVSRT